MDSLQSLFYFVIAIAVLVAFHEFGHYWVARKAGVKVIRFSIGFGKTLWSWQKNSESTEFVFAAIPMGGYVKMVDEREGEVKPADLPFAFNRQSVFARAAIVAAGPLFNLLLAVLLFWIVFVLGETGFKPIVGVVESGTLAAEAGFVEQDEIISINQKPTPTWMVALDELLSEALNGNHDIVINVKTLEGEEQMRVMVISDAEMQNPETLQKRLGLKPWSPIIKPIIVKLVEQGVAEPAGLHSGDLIISADGVQINEWQQWVNYVQARPEQLIKLIIQRDGVQMPIQLTPRKELQSNGQAQGKIGAGVEFPKDVMDALVVEHALSPWEALPAAVERTGFYAISTVKMIGKMLIGSASVDNLSGPISIAQYAGQSAEMGFSAFLRFLALISVSLGVLNLLPVPILDGGHLLFYGIEAIKGSPVSEKIQVYFQQIGMFLLMSLMVLAMFMDLNRLFQ